MGGKSSTPKMEVTEYRMSEHFGICSGPVDYISEIIINEKSAWVGRRVENGEILINKPSLFGGVKKEGGAVGTATFLSGGPTQTIPERLAEKAGLTTATMPAYRGMASLWFTENDGASNPGFYWTANSPYLPGVWVKVSRASTELSETKARIYRDLNGPISIYFLLDRSNSLSSSEFAAIKSAANAGLDLLEEAIEELDVRVDIGVRFYSAGSTAIERTNCDAADISAIRSFIASATQVTGGDVEAAMEFIEDWFLATVSTTFSRRAVVFVTDTNTEDNMTAAAAGPAADMLDQDSGTFNLTDGTAVDMYAINYVSTNTTWTSLLDNTPQDGVPVITSTDETGLTNAVADAVRSFDFDSNPAHIIYDCLTNSDWGMGAPVSAIDVDSFETAADTLYDERFGLSMIWTQQSTIETFLAEIVDHIEATLFVSPRTGKLTLKLIRDDYAITGLPEFTPDNSVVTNFSRKLWGETVNEIVVTFTNPDNEEEETVIAQDLANISSQGGIVSDGRNYYGVRTRALATKLAHRDLRAASTPLASCDIEINREAWDMLPGDVVILNSPDDGVEQIVMRVGPVDYGKPGDSVIKAQLIEDVFSLPLADYTVPPKTEAQPTSEDPTPADDTLILTLPYFLAVQESSDVIGSAEYPEVVAGVLASEDGSDTSSFELYGEVVDAAGNTSVDTLGTKTITSRGTLQADIDAEVETLFVSFPDRTQGNGPEVGGLMLLEGTGETDSELCLISAFGGSPTAYTMKRGVLDTTPRDWPAGTPVWFVDTSMVFTDPTLRSEGETVDYQVLINTSLGQLELDDAPVVSETLTARPWLPLRPADVTFDGVGFGSVDVSDQVGDSPAPEFTVTWARRNRLTEDSIILAWDAADVTPETDQTTTITVMDLDRNILEVHSGIAGTSYDVPLSSFMDGSPAGLVDNAIVRVTSERDGLESLQGHEITVILASLAISGTPVTIATEGDAYAGFTAAASGGVPPYTYSLVGDWPAGISIDSSTGEVSGTPTDVGSFPSLSVRVTDSIAATDDLPAFVLNVADSALIDEYENADELTHDWANLTGWTTSGVQVSSNRLYGIAGANPSATGKALTVAAGDTVKLTAEIQRVTGVNRAQYVGINFGGTNDGVNASLPNFVGIGIGDTNNRPNVFVGANFSGVTTGSQFIGSDTGITGTWRAIVMADSQNISLVLRKQDGSAEYQMTIPRSAAPNSGAITSVIVWNGDTRGTSGSYIKAIGAKKSLTPFRTQSNAAGTIEGNTGLVYYRNVSDLWRIHLPAGLDPYTPAPICIYFPQAVTGTADSPVREARALNVDQALDGGGYIVLSANDNGDQWGNQQSIDNFKSLMEWVRARINCGSLVFIGVSGGGMTAWNSLLRGDMDPVAIAGICPVTDLDNMEANATFTASVRAAYGAADHAEYLTNSAGYDPNDATDFTSFTGKGVKFYVAASGDTVVPNSAHVDVFEPKIAPYATTAVDLSGTSHLDTEQFQGTDLVTFFNTYV